MKKILVQKISVLAVIMIVIFTGLGIQSVAEASSLFEVTVYGFEFHTFSDGSSVYKFLVHVEGVDPAEVVNIVLHDPNGIIVCDGCLAEWGVDYFLMAPELGSSLPLIGEYSITLEFVGGIYETQTMLTTTSMYSTATPEVISPLNNSIIVDQTPEFTWLPFESPQKGPGEVLGYRVEVHESGWGAGVDGSQTSVTYNFDGSAPPGFSTLPPGGYELNLFAYEDTEDTGSMLRRTSIRSIRFTVASSVEIDIKPGGDPDPINPKSKGNIPVAILTTDVFDAAAVDPPLVLFEEASPLRWSMEDVDGDGDIDMILHFKTQETGIICGDTSVTLIGQTFGGQAIGGSDAMNTVRCK